MKCFLIDPTNACHLLVMVLIEFVKVNLNLYIFSSNILIYFEI